MPFVRFVTAWSFASSILGRLRATPLTLDKVRWGVGDIARRNTYRRCPVARSRVELGGTGVNC